MRTHILLAAGILLAIAAGAADEPIAITTFELKDGRKIEAVRYATFHSGELKSYVVTTLDGKKTMLLENDLLGTKQEQVALETLPAEVRANIQKMRAAEAAARAEAEIQAARQKVIAEAKRVENQAQTGVRKIGADLAYAQKVLEGAEFIIRNTPVETAKADARYDAAKTELSSGTGIGYGAYRVAYPNYSRSDYLRHEMTRAAEEKARLENEKEEAEAIAERTKQNIKLLDERMAAALVELNAARTATKKAIEKAKAAEQAKPDHEMSIGKAPAAK